MNLLEILQGIWTNSGFASLQWQQLVMILISFVLLYLAIVKKFEPLLLVPIGFGILLANLPNAGLMADPTGIMDTSACFSEQPLSSASTLPLFSLSCSASRPRRRLQSASSAAQTARRRFS